MEPNDNTFVSTVLRVETDPLTSRVVVTHIANHAADASDDVHQFIRHTRTAETDHPVYGFPSMVLGAVVAKLIGHHVEFETAEDDYTDEFDGERIVRVKDLGINPNVDVADPRFRAPAAEPTEPDAESTFAVFTGTLTKSFRGADGSHIMTLDLPGYGMVFFLATLDSEAGQAIEDRAVASFGDEVTVVAGPHRHSASMRAMSLIRLIDNDEDRA